MVLDRAVEHYRQGGLRRLVSKTRDQLAFSREYVTFGLERALLTDRQWYEYTVWRNRRGVDAAADPRRLRYVDPNEVVHTSPFETLFCFREFGAVRDGDWDRDCERLDERFDYIWEALTARYEDGAAWEDVDLVQQVLAGEERWRFATGEEVWDWVERLDAVYASIRRDGYRAARELLDVPFETAAPFPLKLATWLRMAGVPYDFVDANDPSQGPKGKSPWIAWGGESMGDSTLIIQHVRQQE